MYKINEIFESIQGEGFYTGRLVTFVRFSGCNLNCDFCDTNHEASRMMSATDIIKAVNIFKSKIVVLTGGEPMLQVNARLLAKLRANYYKLHLETNGTIESKLIKEFDHVSVSPKSWNSWKVQKGNDLKILIEYGVEFDPKKLLFAKFDNYIFQPIDEYGKLKQNTQAAVLLAKQFPRFKIGVQLHKILNVC